MSKPSGMKITVPAPVKVVPSPPQDIDYDNQFLDDDPQIADITEQQSLEERPNSLTHSDYIVPKNIDNETKMLKNLNNGMQRLSVSILQMREKYKDLDMDEILFKKRSQKKEEQIKQFLTAKKVQKTELLKKRRKRMQRQAKKLQQSIVIQNQLVKSRKEEQIKKSISKLKQIRVKKQRNKKEEQQKNKKIAIIYSKIKQQQKLKPKIHKRMAAQEKKLKNNRIEEQKQILAKRKENNKPLNLQQIQTHGKKHEQLLQQLQTVKRSQREQELLKILEKNKTFQDIYRGKSYDIAVQQFQQIKVKRSQPAEKYKKIRNYQDYVREQFLPPPRVKDQDNQHLDMRKINSTSRLSHRQIKRYRYLQGVSYGEIVQNIPIAKSDTQQKKLGNDYMSYMRSLPKRKMDQNFSLSENKEQEERELRLKIKKPNPLAERSGRKSVEIKISEKPTRDELGMLINQLKFKDIDIERKQKVVKYVKGSGTPNANHKIIGDDLVYNIQRKLNLLSKL